MGEIIKSLSGATATASVKKLRKHIEKMDAAEVVAAEKMTGAPMKGIGAILEREMFGDPTATTPLGPMALSVPYDAAGARCLLEAVHVLTEAFRRMGIPGKGEGEPMSVRGICEVTAVTLAGIEGALRGHWNIPHESSASSPAESKTPTAFMREIEAMGIEGDGEEIPHAED